MANSPVDNYAIFGSGGAGTRQMRAADNSPKAGVGLGADINVAVDGTPPRVAGIIILSGALLAALKLLGWRFNVGVSN